MSKDNISAEELFEFLQEANRNSYASDAPKAPSTRPGSVDYHFEKRGLKYHDTYFGPRDFIGSEIVYKDNVPVWGMNYFGHILYDDIREKVVYDFLRKALMQEVQSIIPVRGPEYFLDDKDKNWSYRFLVTGYLKSFIGEEVIIVDGVIIYRCVVHGGYIK